MKRFWTADLHFGHHNILEYENRPFKSADHMADRLIANINGRVAPEDMLIHVGDLACYGKARGVEGSRVHAKEYVKRINGTFINVEGNHDANNKVKSACDFMLVRMGGMRASVAHRPADQLNIDVKKLGVDFHICGHVHSSFKSKVIDGLINVNVGCDVWRYMPIDDSQIIGLVGQINRGLKDDNASKI